jgi:hypothetical protein
MSSAILSLTNLLLGVTVLFTLTSAYPLPQRIDDITFRPLSAAQIAPRYQPSEVNPPWFAEVELAAGHRSYLLTEGK